MHFEFFFLAFDSLSNLCLYLLSVNLFIVLVTVVFPPCPPLSWSCCKYLSSHLWVHLWPCWLIHPSIPLCMFNPLADWVIWSIFSINSQVCWVHPLPSWQSSTWLSTALFSSLIFLSDNQPFTLMAFALPANLCSLIPLKPPSRWHTFVFYILSCQVYS